MANEIEKRNEAFLIYQDEEESSVFHITNDSTGYDYINNKRDFAIKITLDKKSNTGEIMLFNGLVPAS